MSRLTAVDRLPRADTERAGPHRYRMVGKNVVLTGPAGHWAVLSVGEYRDFLRGLPSSHPRFNELSEKGLIANALDFDALAGEAVETSWLAWEGPRRHLVFLERGGAVMDLQTARETVEFIFTVPASVLHIELVAEDWNAAWRAGAFFMRYARRRAQWNTRQLRLFARIPPAGLSAARLRVLAETLTGPRVAYDSLARAPKRTPSWVGSWNKNRRKNSALPGLRALLRVGPDAADPVSWMRYLRSAGFGSAHIEPGADFAGAPENPAFLDFYERALAAILEGKPDLVEEWAASFLRRIPSSASQPRDERPAPLPGHDVLGELAYSPEGGIYTSGTAIEGGESLDALQLGVVERTAYEEFGGKQTVRIALSALEGDHQPMCFHCAYRPYCGVAPAQNLRSQGTIWGHTATSPHCAAQMGLLDVLFGRLQERGARKRLEYWADHWSFL